MTAPPGADSCPPTPQRKHVHLALRWGHAGLADRETAPRHHPGLEQRRAAAQLSRLAESAVVSAVSQPNPHRYSPDRQRHTACDLQR